MRVALYQDILAPYRIPLFNQLRKYFELTVFIGRKKSTDRKWGINSDDVRFNCIYLNAKEMKIFKKYFSLPNNLKSVYKSGLEILVLTDDLRCIISNIFLLLKKTKYNFKVVLWCSEFDAAYRKKMIPAIFWPIIVFYKKFLIANVDSFIAYSPQAADYYSIKYKKSKEKIFWGTQSTYFDPIDIRLKKFDNPEKIMLYIGYFRKVKGLDLLVDILKNELKNETYKCYLIGDGPEKQSLVSQIGDLKKIILLGYTEGEKKHQLLLSADIFILPTLYDPWANTTNEGAAYALPIITTTANGASGTLVVENHNGRIINPGNRDELCSAIKQLLNDNELRKRMSINSWELSKKFSLDWACQNFLSAIKEAWGQE